LFYFIHGKKKKVIVNFELKLNNKLLKQEKSIRYLGIYIDCNLSWKDHIEYISRKIKRNIGILSKLRHYINSPALVNLYYALIYPFLIYGVLSWGHTYKTTLQPITVLQKKALRLMDFSPFCAHTSLIFKKYNILKLSDLVEYCTSIFMYKFKNNILPCNFIDYFKHISEVHSYQTRSATKQNLYLPKAKTNYGKFNIKFVGTKIWNSLE